MKGALNMEREMGKEKELMLMEVNIRENTVMINLMEEVLEL